MRKINQSTGHQKGGLERVDPVDMAGRVLSFLAGEPERLSRFFALTGVEAGTLRTAAAAPGFARSVLGYLIEDEDLLLAFARQQGTPPERVAAACRMAIGPTAW